MADDKDYCFLVPVLPDKVDVAKNFYDVGMVPKNDVLQAEVNLANAKQNVVVAQNDVLIARAAFNTVLRRPVDTPFAVADVLTHQPFLLAYETAVETAVAARPDIQIADLEVILAEKDIVLTKKDYYPSIDIKIKQGKIHKGGSTNTNINNVTTSCDEPINKMRTKSFRT